MNMMDDHTACVCECVCVFSLPPLPVMRAQTLGVKLALRLSEVKLGLLAATELL